MKIGIVSKRFNTTLGVTLPYVEFAQMFGEPIMVNPLSDEVDKTLDLLILPGGADVDPSRYNSRPNFNNSRSDSFLEYFDRNVLPRYITNGTPIFGICRGFQTLNVAFGGSLNQHIAQKVSTDGRDELVDTQDLFIKLHPEGFNFSGVGKIKNNICKFKTNSLHHQGVSRNNIAKCLTLLGANSQYGNVEIFIHNKLPVAAVQYHPEEMMHCDNYTSQLIDYIMQMERINKENLLEKGSKIVQYD